MDLQEKLLIGSLSLNTKKVLVLDWLPQYNQIQLHQLNDAWNHKNQEQRELWRDAIQKELNSMNKRNVWSIVLITEIPNGRKPIGNKWVLKIKRDGRYRARLVCLGYTQIPGIDFKTILLLWLTT